MEQNIKKRKLLKKERSLNRFFMLFLAHAILSFLCTTALWVCLLFAAVSLRLIIPANAVEQAISIWRASLDGHTAIAPEDIPDGAGYAFFDTDGTLLQTDLEGNALTDAEKLAASDHQTNIRRNGSGICLKLRTDTQCVVVSYRLVASFRPPFLQRLFPNAELFFFLLLLLMLIADFMIIALHHARKLNGELQKLAAAADQIREKNLVFTTEKTRITQFNQIMDSLNRLRADLQCSLREQWFMEQQKKRQLTALTHDIKTPLAIVTGNAELLSETEQTGEQKKYTAFILDHSRQIHRYVTAMLELSRADSLSDSVCRIKTLLLAAAQDLETLGKDKHLSCSLKMNDLPDDLLVPKDKLQRILANLIDNAVQYSPEKGTVFLSAYVAKKALHITVRDEGNGFSKEALSLAATEFYRADTSRSSKEHFGLGLSITGQIIADLKGTLLFENAPEKGALVRVSIPLGEEISKNL